MHNSLRPFNSLILLVYSFAIDIVLFTVHFCHILFSIFLRFKDFEYIIIDGASNDGTVDIIKKYDKYIDYWVSEPDQGLYYAMNKGIEAATGDWIYIHNAGGVFYDKNTLSKLFSNNLEGVDAFFGYIWSVENQ